MRRLLIAGNWKMNKTIAEAIALTKSLVSALPGDTEAEVAVIPPFIAMPAVVQAAAGSRIKVGAQDVYFEKSGAFTGEISCEMIADAGASFALVGHSERRHVIGENDELIRKKLDALIHYGLDVMLCIGELIEEREAGRTEERLETQVRAGLSGLTAAELEKVTLAYEPVWAIGTGKTATPDQAQQAHAFVRKLVAEMAGSNAAEKMRIQYGGSVKPGNAAELMGLPDVDGALIGGASLKPEPFLDIIKAC